MKLCPPGPDAHEVSTVTAGRAQLKPRKLENLNLTYDITYPSGLLGFVSFFFFQMVKQNGRLSEIIITDKAFACRCTQLKLVALKGAKDFLEIH